MNQILVQTCHIWWKVEISFNEKEVTQITLEIKFKSFAILLVSKDLKDRSLNVFIFHI